MKIKNFLSHALTEMGFKPITRLLIDGISGSGKSSIVESIVWVLFGEGRVANRSLIRNGSKEALVELVLDNGITEWTITRSISDSGKHSLTVTSPTEIVPSVGVKETQLFIERTIIGCSRELFINSSCYPQDNSESFVRQNAAKRKEIILSMVAGIDFDGMLKMTKEKITEINQQKATVQGTLNVLEQSLASNKVLALDKDVHKAKMDALHAKCDELVGQIAVLANEKAAYELAVQKHRSAERALMTDKEYLDRAIDENNNLNDSITTANEKIVKLESMEGMATADVSLYEKAKADQSQWLREMSPLMAKDRMILDLMNSLSSKYATLSAQKAKEEAALVIDCPAIKAPCVMAQKVKDDRVAEVQKRIDELNTDSQKLESDRAKILEQIKELGPEPLYDQAGHRLAIERNEVVQKNQMKLAELRGYIEALTSKLPEVSSRIHTLTDKITDLTRQELEARENLNALKAKMPELMSLEQQYAEARTEHANAQVKLFRAMEAIEIIKNYENDIQVCRNSIAKNDSDLVALQAMKEALGQNGMKAMVVDMVIPRLEEKANNILGLISDFQLRIETQRPGTSGAMVEGLFLTVVNPAGMEMDFDSYSGGERLKVIVAISEALADLQKLDFRILDELFVGLDEETTEKFAQSLLTIQERYGQLVCVSHIRNVKEIFTDSVTVVKTGDVSTVIWD